jgi:ABC-2 type transport system permease protein
VKFARIRLVARREFLASVTRRGFLIGLIAMPVLVAVLVVMLPRFLASRTPQVSGQVLVVDRTGAVTDELRTRIDPAAILARRMDPRRRAEGPPPGFGGAPQAMGPPVPQLQIIEASAQADLQALKRRLGAIDGGPLALVVIQPDAVRRDAAKPDFGSYDLFIASRLDEATEATLHESLRLALVGARMKAGGFDADAVETSLRVARPNSVIVAGGSEQQSQRGFNRLLPFIMGLLLFIGVMSSAQTLMGSTIEEKSSRVAEVLLAAASPLELMWGKLIGQLGVGLTVLALYIGLGLLGLTQFAMLGLLEPMHIVYLFVFFLLSYLIYGSLMLSIGAAVNQLADAQALLGPVMLLLIAPYVMAPMIGAAPNSAVSVVLSFLPPINCFAMLARIASFSPPPAWQIWATVGVGLAAAAAAVWFASKIFRVGLLMQGKPPNFATMIRWARMA